MEWLYPAGALRLTLSPRLPWSALGPGESSRSPVSACIKPDQHWGGAQLYLERDGVLELLVGDETSESSGPARVRCFSAMPGERPALFLQATPHQDISRRIAAFRYELRGDWTAQPSVNTDPIGSQGEYSGRYSSDLCNIYIVYNGCKQMKSMQRQQNIDFSKIYLLNIKQKMFSEYNIGPEII